MADSIGRGPAWQAIGRSVTELDATRLWVSFVLGAELGFVCTRLKCSEHESWISSGSTSSTSDTVTSSSSGGTASTTSTTSSESNTDATVTDASSTTDDTSDTTGIDPIREELERLRNLCAHGGLDPDTNEFVPPAHMLYACGSENIECFRYILNTGRGKGDQWVRAAKCRIKAALERSNLRFGEFMTGEPSWACYHKAIVVDGDRVRIQAYDASTGRRTGYWKTEECRVIDRAVLEGCLPLLEDPATDPDSIPAQCRAQGWYTDCVATNDVACLGE